VLQAHESQEIIWKINPKDKEGSQTVP